MLKPQDIVILIKILSTLTLAKRSQLGQLTQKDLSFLLCMSASEVSVGTKRLVQSGLLGPTFSKDSPNKMVLLPIQAACEECLISGVKYFFPAELGPYTSGLPTSYAAPVFENQIVVGDAPILVWPDARGTHRGMELKPLYSSVPTSLREHPDQEFYDLLALLDAIRGGRARERNIAIKILRNKINGHENKK